MDYHSLKRSELQALCKKHGIPANSTNVVMADKLSELLHVKQEKPKPRARQRTCIKSAVETIAETESAVSRRQAKRVRFSPEVEYERSDKKQKALEPVVTEMKGRRKSVVKKVDEPAVDNVNTVTDDVQIPVKVTRSRAPILEKDDVIPTNVSKQGRRAVKDVEKENDAVKETEVNIGKVTRSKSNTVAKGDFQLEKSKQTIVCPARVTRSKAQAMTEDSKDPDVSSQAKKNSGRQTEIHEVNVELSKEVKDVAVRVTRSRRQTLNDDSVVANPAMEKKRTRRDDSVVAYPLIEKKRTVAGNSKDPNLSPQGKKKSSKRTEKDVELSKEVKDVVVRVTRSRGQTLNDDSVYADPAAEKKRTRRDDSVVTIPPFEKKRTRRDPIVAEVSKTQDNADKGARQLRRNKAIAEDSTSLNQNGSKVESVNEMKVTRSKVPLENKSSRGKGKSKVEDKEDEEPLEPAGRNNVTRRKSVIQLKSSEVVLPLEEPLDIPARNTRRKSVIEPKDTEVVYTRRKSIIQPKITEVVRPLEEHVHVPARKDTRRKSVAQPKITEVVHLLEEHVHVPARKDTRRKSVFQPENIEVVLSLEEPLNVPAKRETRRKSVVQKAQAEESKKLLVLKRETVKETAVPGSPSVTTRKSVEKKQSTDASESEMKAVASGSGSNISGKRSIVPIIEDQFIETKPVSVDKDPVAKKEQRSGVKTPASRKGVMIEDNNRSIKRAKLSEIKQSDSEDDPEKSNTVETPISKMANLELDDKVIETEQTPANVESGRRMTRGVSRSSRNEPSQSAIKEQNTVASRLTSRKTPGRFTRSGIKDDEKSTTEETPISKMANLDLDDKVIETEQTPANVKSGRVLTRGLSQSALKEQNTSAARLTSRKTPGRKTHSGIKVDEKAQPSGSTQQSQPLDDTQVVSHEVAEASSSPDETIADPSEVSKDANAQILEQSGDLSASESVQLPTVDALSDGSHVQNQNQEVHVSSEMISGAEVQVIVNSEKSVVPEFSEKEMELTKLSGLKQSDSEDHSEKINTEETPISKIANLELDEGIETQQTSAIVESGRRLTRGLSRSSRKEPRQLTIKEQNTGAARLSSRKTPGRFTRRGSKVDEKAQPSESTNQTEPVKLPTVDALLDGSHVQNQNQDVHVSSEMVSDAEVLLTVNSEKSAIPDISEKEMKLTKSEYKSEGLENDARVEEPFVSVVKTAVTEESLDILLGQSDNKGKSKEIEALVEPSVLEGVSHFIADDQALTKIEDDDHDNEEDRKGSSQKHEDVADKGDTKEMGFVVEGDYVEPNRDDILEPSTGDDKLESFGMDEIDVEDVKVTVPESSTAHREPDKEFVIEDKKEPATVPEGSTGHSELAKELDTDAVPSTGNDILEIPAMGQFDDEEGVANSKEPESNTNDKDGESQKEFAVEAKKEPATVPESSSSHSEPAKELDTDAVSSIGNDVHEIPILGQFDDEEGVDEIKDPESNTNDKDGESGKELLTSCYRSAMEDQDVGDEEPESVQNENVPLLPEVFTSSSDQEPEPSQNEDVTQLPEDLTKSPDLELEPAVILAENEAPCNTVNASTGKEAPQSPELVDEKEQTDCDKYGDDYLNHGVFQENPTIEESLPIVCAVEESTGDRLATSQLPGVLGPYGSPIRERDSSVDDIVSDLPASFKNEDKNKHEDWGSYSNGTDGLQNPVSANGSDDVAGRCMRDGQVSGHQTTSPAVANTTQEFFDWTDSTLKALLTTPGMAQDSHVKERQQSTVRFALPDKDDTEINKIQTPDLSLKTLFTTPAPSQVSHVKDHLESTAVRFDIPDEGYNATQNQYSSLKTISATSATTRIGHIKEHEQSAVRFALSDKGDREGNASRDPESSLKEKTPATTRDSHVQEPEQITVRSALFAEDETEEHNTTHNPDSSLKTLSTKPATTPISCVKDTQENSVNIALLDEDDKATKNLGTSLKMMFTTPTTMRFSHAKSCQESTVRFDLPDEDDMKGNPPQNPDSSLKTFATRATSQISHVKDSQQHEFNCALLAEDPTENPDLSLKMVFTSPVTASVSQENVVINALPDEGGADESESNATTQNSNVQDHEQMAVKSALPDNGSEGSSRVIDDTQGKATQNPYSSLKALFATPAKTQGSYLEENHQSTVRFALPGDSFHEDEKQGTATQHQNLGEDRKSETSGFMKIVDFSHKYFDDEEADYSPGENVGKNKVDELNQDDMKSETAGTSHSDASGLKDRSNEPSTDLNDNTHWNATGSPGPTEDPESEIFDVLNVDFARKLFGDEAGSGSSDNSGDEMKQHDTGRRDM